MCCVEIKFGINKFQTYSYMKGFIPGVLRHKNMWNFFHISISWCALHGSQDSSISVVMGFGLDSQSLSPGRDKRFLCSPQHPDWL
jgi:hypothetical protein